MAVDGVHALLLLAGEIRDEGFGLVASIAVPGAGHLALYEPRHPTAITPGL